MKKQLLLLLVVLLGSLMAGRYLPQQAHSGPGTSLAADRVADPAELPEACRSSVTITALQRLQPDNNSETYLVTWATGLPCLTTAAVTVKATKRDGSIETKTEIIENVNQALIKVRGFRSDNPTVSATATVIVNGIQRGTTTHTADV